MPTQKSKPSEDAIPDKKKSDPEQNTEKSDGQFLTTDQGLKINDVLKVSGQMVLLFF